MTTPDTPPPSSPAPEPARDPRKLAAVLVQRVGRAPLVLGGTLLIVVLWTSVFLISDPGAKRQAPPPAAPSQTSANATRSVVQQFLEEARRSSERQRRERLAEQAAELSAEEPLLEDPSEDHLHAPEPATGRGFEAPPRGPAPGWATDRTATADPQRSRLAEAMNAPPLVSQGSPGRVLPAGGLPPEGSRQESLDFRSLLEATQDFRRTSSRTPANQPQAVPPPEAAPTRPRPDSSLQTLTAGTVMPAVLTSEVNSDTPGVVTATVHQDVYDSRSGQHLLIPAGSRLVGTSGSATHGQNRLVIVWTRLALPNGSSVDLSGLPSADASGATGLRDRTNRHVLRTVGAALLLSAFSAAAQLSQPDRGTDRGLSAQQVASGALGQQLNQAGASLIERELRTAPTLTIRAGTLFNVVLNSDLGMIPYVP